MLSVEQSRVRQRRLLEEMKSRQLDAVVIAGRHHVYYLTAYYPSWMQESVCVLFADGYACLIAPNHAPSRAAADAVETFEANPLGTLRQELAALAAEKATTALRSRRAGRIGFDASAVASQVLGEWEGEAMAIDPILWQLRRRKDADELALMVKAIECTQAMYARARQIVAPGVEELEVFTQLNAAAVTCAGEPLSALLGNDFACGSGGGQPRAGRKAEAGELYVLDLGPAYRGYFADNCRSLAVDGKPTDAQHKAWEDIVSCLAVVEKMAAPGVRCRDICDAVDENLRTRRGHGMPHHLGHGVGLQPHEFPHLNPKWDDVLLEGEVFTAEPGVYSREINAGLRLENQYLVTAGGVRNLVDASLDLA